MMAKRREMDEKERRAAWKALPQSDKRFLSALILISEAIGDEKLHYAELPTRLERTLRKADRDTLFSIIVECLGLLLDAPAMQRVKQAHRSRADKTPSQAGRKRGPLARSARKRRAVKRSRSE